MATKEKESYFDVAIAYMRGDPELTDCNMAGSELEHFIKLWDKETEHFRQCVGNVFRVAPQFKRKKSKTRLPGPTTKDTEE